MRNQGGLLLARTGATQDAIADVCGTSRQAVQAWISGSKKPTKERRAKLKKAYKIPTAAWDQEAEAPSSPSLPAEKPLSTQDLIDTIRLEATKLVTELRSTQGSTTFERSRALRQLSAVVEQLNELTAGAERRLLKSQEWADMRERLVAVLSKFPDAREAVLQAIESLEEP